MTYTKYRIYYTIIILITSIVIFLMIRDIHLTGEKLESGIWDEVPQTEYYTIGENQ